MVQIGNKVIWEALKEWRIWGRTGRVYKSKIE
jgi:hypothetical protein